MGRGRGSACPSLAPPHSRSSVLSAEQAWHQQLTQLRAQLLQDVVLLHQQAEGRLRHAARAVRLAGLKDCPGRDGSQLVHGLPKLPVWGGSRAAPPVLRRSERCVDRREVIQGELWLVGRVEQIEQLSGAQRRSSTGQRVGRGDEPNPAGGLGSFRVHHVDDSCNDGRAVLVDEFGAVLHERPRRHVRALGTWLGKLPEAH
mmetsp:Transcript_11447/g.44313  ORF Transcript_11447/g.44313 Transcript_11447/m.44313 type:complete len:201 (+) Transcript_11447:1847-2449(+)